MEANSLHFTAWFSGKWDLSPSNDPFLSWFGRGGWFSTFSHGFMGESTVYLGKTFTTSWSSQEIEGPSPPQGILRFHSSVFGHL